MLTTKRLFDEDVYLTECAATVIADTADGVVLDRTIFFPEAGGQSCDRGFAGPYKVTYVKEKNGVLYHVLEKEEGLCLEEQTLECRLDWPHRFLNMQRHCGEHLLSAAFYELYGGVNRGFHMGKDYMTIDISLEDDPAYKEMTDEMAAAAERRANELIWQDLPVNRDFYADGKEAAKRPLRKALAIEKDVIIVSVGDPLWLPGAVACCGTHPAHTGAVGQLKVYRWESHKGMARVYFDAGENAFIRSAAEEALIRKLGKENSTEFGELEKKLEQKEKLEQEKNKQLSAIRRAYLAAEAEKLKALYDGGQKTAVYENELLTEGDMNALRKMLPKELPGLLLMVLGEENSLLLHSGGKPDCGRLIKDNAPAWNGKGGGRPDNGRVRFPRREELDCFLEFARNALR